MSKINRYCAAVNLGVLFITAAIIIFCSSNARRGAADGFELAVNTVIPSLLPLLIIFLTIIKSTAGSLMTRLFGSLSRIIFNLPEEAFTALFFGLIGGYPTGALLTRELYDKGAIDDKQARRLMRFNFCGGAGFIVTAVGNAVYGNTKTGILLLLSNISAAIIVGFILSFSEKRLKKSPLGADFGENVGEALIGATKSACSSVLTMTGYIILFSCVFYTLGIKSNFAALFEITNGICKNRLSLPLASAYLSFGGICIHLQLYGIIRSVKMKYADFLLFRIVSSLLSFVIMRLICIAYPQSAEVFASTAEKVQFSGVNTTLGVLMIIGCAVCVLDLNSRKALGSIG